MDLGFCRTCLRNETSLSPLFNTNAANMLNYTRFWEVFDNDGFPNQICNNCEALLTESYNFKRLCEKSQSTLQRYLCEGKNDYQWLSVSDVENSNKQIESELYSNDEYPKQFLENSFIINEEKNAKSCLKELQCDECILGFACDEDLKQHKSESHNQSRRLQVVDEHSEELTAFLESPLPPPLAHSCRKCSQSFNAEYDLELHQSTHSDNYICIACNKVLTSRQMLKRHIKIHMVNKPHACKQCGKSFSESYALTKHLRRHSGIPREKRHVCKECGQRFSEPYYLNVHIRKHTGERPLQCSTCDKSFADPRSLKAHNMIHSGEKPYKCHICPKAFSQSVNLTKHIRTHTGERPYVCDNCGKSFTQSSSLDKHYRIHTGEKPYSCDTCMKRFSEKSTLVQHIRTHTGEKPYMCQICGAHYASSSELKLHDRKHSGIKKNVCDVCHKDFATPNNLKIHKRSHTGERPFSCSVCSKRFVDKSSLKKHSKLHVDVYS